MDQAFAQPIRTSIKWCLLLALTGAIACAAVAWQRTELLWHAYLYAFLDCWLIVMGATGLLALGNLTGGTWAIAGRPFYLAIAQTVPMLALLFVPIGLGLDQVYLWAQPSATEQLHFSASKAAYFESTFLLGRAVAYFAAWLIIAWLLGHVSRWELAPAESGGMRRAGALSLVVLVPTATFAAFDWSMSLEPQWYSSLYGALLLAGGVLAAHALAVLGLAITWRHAPSAMFLAGGAAGATGDQGKEPADVLNDMGNLTLAFVMVWSYFAFSQFLIIWSGNLPNEITWYLRRLENGWQFVAIAVVLLNFVVPFLSLLSRDLKRIPGKIACVAVLLLAAYDVQMYWTVVPAFDSMGILPHIVNIAALAAVGGLWLALVCWLAMRAMQSCQAAAQGRRSN